MLRSPVFEVGCFALGAIVGSFANVCIHRLPLGQSVVSPPSRCPHCGALIRPWDNIPVLSYVILGGRCRNCRAPISARYPLVEAVNGLAWFGLAWRGGPTPQTAVAMAFVTALLVLALIDLEHQLLPDVITLPGIALGLLASFLPGSPVTPLVAAASAAGGYLMLALLDAAAVWFYRRVRKQDIDQAIGQGDWKLIAMLGAFLGWRWMLLSAFLGTVLGAAFGIGLIASGRGTGGTKVPLGTFLALGAVAVVFSGDTILRSLLRLQAQLALGLLAAVRGLLGPAGG
jgi:leader peptidase (prepilin peptidase) / N-methyltransferase